MNLSLILSIFILLTARFSFAQQNIWEPVGEPLEGNTFIVFAIDGDDNLYTGTYFDFFKSTNNGDEWTSIYNGYYVTSIVFNNQGEMFIGTAGGGGIFKSPDKGETWIHLSDTLINYSITDLDINSNGHLFAAIRGRGMYRSTDDGESWDEIINGLTYYNSIKELYIPKNGPFQDYLFVSVCELTDFSYIFRSDNSGVSWEQMNISNGWFWTYTFVGTSDGTIYIGLVDTAPHSNNGGILKSVNSGYDWISAGSNAITQTLILDNNEYIYAGTTGGWMGGCQGIIRTTNAGNDWEPFSSGLISSCGCVLACNTEGILFAGNGSGIYRTIKSTTDIVENEEGIPSEFTLHQNYPNPFNPSTKIRYELPQSEKVTLKVYDIIGKEIATLVNKEKPAGSYEVNFNANKLASGIYYYTLTAGNFTQSKKMILMK